MGKDDRVVPLMSCNKKVTGRSVSVSHIMMNVEWFKPFS